LIKTLLMLILFQVTNT